MSVASYHEFWCHHHRGQVWYLLRPLYAIVVALFHWCDPLLLFWDWIHCLELLFLHTKPYWSDPEFCLFCFPTHEWCCIPPVRYSQTNCVHAKYNMIILVEIEPAECHSDPYWYSLSGGGDQILKVILGGLTVCAQTHLMRPEVPAQCFTMDFVPTVVKTFQTIEVVPSGPFTGPEQWLVGAQCESELWGLGPVQLRLLRLWGLGPG